MDNERQSLLYRIDSERSEIAFSVKHLMISKVKGHFERFRGEFRLDPRDPEKSKLEGIIEVASIRTQDSARDTYLRTGEFFDPARYPEMSFCSEVIRPEGKELVRIDGILQIKEVRGAVELRVTSGAHILRAGVPSTGEPPASIEMQAQAKIDRRSFGLVWPPAIEAGGVLVGNEVEIDLKIHLVRV
jgi:polyisoprenoid-binding protein YceI